MHENKNQPEEQPDQAKESSMVANKLEELKESGELEQLTAYASEKYQDPEIYQTLRTTRIEVDSAYLTLDSIRTYFPSQASRYISLAITEIQSARQFLGIMLREKGAPNPYTDGNTEQVDKGIVFGLNKIGRDSVERLKFLREHLADELTALCVFADRHVAVSIQDMVAQQTAIAKLMAARCWLGEALAVCLP